jgi:hypothetical protein
MRYITQKELNLENCLICSIESKRTDSIVLHGYNRMYVHQNGMLVQDVKIKCMIHEDSFLFGGEEITLEIMEAPTICSWCGEKHLRLKQGGWSLCNFICDKCNKYFSLYPGSRNAKKEWGDNA